MKRFISLRKIVVALGVVAMIAALTFTIKLVAAEWGGQISAMETIQLSPAQCPTGGNGGSADCLGTPPCDPAVSCCP